MHPVPLTLAHDIPTTKKTNKQRWEGELDGKEGFIPAKYVEHAPTWFYPASEEGAGYGKAETASANANGSNDDGSDSNAEADQQPPDSDLPPPPAPQQLHATHPPHAAPSPLKHLPPGVPNLAKVWLLFLLYELLLQAACCVCVCLCVCLRLCACVFVALSLSLSLCVCVCAFCLSCLHNLLLCMAPSGNQDAPHKSKT